MRWADEMVVRIAKPVPLAMQPSRTVTGSDTPAMGNARIAKSGCWRCARLADLLSRLKDDEQAWRNHRPLRSAGLRDGPIASQKSRSCREITQSVFVTVAQNSPPPGQTLPAAIGAGSFEPWLFRITMNRVGTRRQAKRQATPTDTKVIADAMPSEAGSTPDIELSPELKRLRGLEPT